MVRATFIRHKQNTAAVTTCHAPRYHLAVSSILKCTVGTHQSEKCDRACITLTASAVSHAQLLLLLPHHCITCAD